MRSIPEINKDLAMVEFHLMNLILEKKLTLTYLRGQEVSAEILTEQAMEKMRHEKG